MDQTSQRSHRFNKHRSRLEPGVMSQNGHSSRLTRGKMCLMMAQMKKRKRDTLHKSPRIAILTRTVEMVSSEDCQQRKPAAKILFLNGLELAPNIAAKTKSPVVQLERMQSKIVKQVELDMKMRRENAERARHAFLKKQWRRRRELLQSQRLKLKQMDNSGTPPTPIEFVDLCSDDEGYQSKSTLSPRSDTTQKVTITTSNSARIMMPHINNCGNANTDISPNRHRQQSQATKVTPTLIRLQSKVPNAVSGISQRLRTNDRNPQWRIPKDRFKLTVQKMDVTHSQNLVHKLQRENYNNQSMKSLVKKLSRCGTTLNCHSTEDYEERSVVLEKPCIIIEPVDDDDSLRNQSQSTRMRVECSHQYRYDHEYNDDDDDDVICLN